MGHSGHGINLYGVVMILMGNLHAGEQSNLKHLSLLHRYRICQSWDHAYGLMTGLYSRVRLTALSLNYFLHMLYE